MQEEKIKKDLEYKQKIRTDSPGLKKEKNKKILNQVIEWKLYFWTLHFHNYVTSFLIMTSATIVCLKNLSMEVKCKTINIHNSSFNFLDKRYQRVHEGTAHGGTDQRTLFSLD